jgi:hypothetical protein
MPAQTLHVPFATKLDALELRQQLGPEQVTIEPVTPGQDLHGELATATAIVVVTLAGLRVLAAYLMKDRRKGVMTRHVQVTMPDGTTRAETITLNVDMAKAPEAEVLKQLAAVCQVAIPDA